MFELFHKIGKLIMPSLYDLNPHLKPKPAVTKANPVKDVAKKAPAKAKSLPKKAAKSK